MNTGRNDYENWRSCGEVVEILIRVKDDYGYFDYRRQAVEEACNLLDKLPRMEEAREYEPVENRVV